MKIKPSELKHTISILNIVKDIDIDGIPIQKKEEILIECRALIKNMSGKEFLMSEGKNSTDTKTFFIRYQKKCNEIVVKKTKIKYKDKIYNVSYASNVKEDNKFYEIVAEVVE